MRFVRSVARRVTKLDAIWHPIMKPTIALTFDSSFLRTSPWLSPALESEGSSRSKELITIWTMFPVINPTQVFVSVNMLASPRPLIKH